METALYNQLTGKILNCAIEVHKELGPGLLESVYQNCMCTELKNSGLFFQQQVVLPVNYKGNTLSKDFIIDIIAENEIIVELKVIEIILPVHEVQLVTYLKLANKKLGLLLNFNVPLLKDGIRRKVNNF